jgi:hypothetical protein
LYFLLLHEAEMKKEYTIKRMHWEPDLAVLARLQALFDEHLSLNNEMIKALQKADGYGNHGGKSNGRDGNKDQAPRDSEQHSERVEGTQESI